MKRRDFLKKGLGAGIMAGALLKVGGVGSVAKGSPAASDSTFDLVAVMGGEPVPMFDKAIAAMGGLGRFVKKGQSVR